MKHATKLPSRDGASSPRAHRLSHTIAKAPPPRKIRIIHVLEPEVIKTEARHFRELVQRLTGKPAPNASCAASPAGGARDGSPSPSLSPSQPPSYDTAATDVMKVKEEAESSSSSGGEGAGFLRALELDGYDEPFFQGLEDFLMEREPVFNF